MRKAPFYRPYRGYHHGRNRLLKLLAAMLVLFGLCAGGIYYLFANEYLIMTEQGLMTNLPFSLPEMPEENVQQPKTEQPENGAQTEAETGEPIQTEEPEAPDKPQEHERSKVLYVPAEKMGDSAYVSRLISLYQQGKLTAVAVDIKENGGKLNYTSALAIAEGKNLTAATAQGVQTGIAACKTAALPVIGRISCFEDDTITRQAKNLSIHTKSGVTWLDQVNKRHLDPYKDEASAYLSGIVKECAAMGLQEVILTDYVFPAKGQQKLIGYKDNGISKSAVLEKRLAEFQQSAGEMKVSVELSESDAPGGKNALTGLDVASLYKTAWRVYAPLAGQSAEGQAALVETVSAVTGGDTEKLVPIYTRPDFFSSDIIWKNSYFNLIENNYSLDNL